MLSQFLIFIRIQTSAATAFLEQRSSWRISFPYMRRLHRRVVWSTGDQHGLIIAGNELSEALQISVNLINGRQLRSSETITLFNLFWS